MYCQYKMLLRTDSTFSIDSQFNWNQQRTMLKIHTQWCHLNQILWLPAPQTPMPKKACREFQKRERYTIFAAHIPDPSDKRFGTIIIGTCIHTLYWASFHQTALVQVRCHPIQIHMHFDGIIGKIVYRTVCETMPWSQLPVGESRDETKSSY